MEAKVDCDVEAMLAASGGALEAVNYPTGEIIYAQGDRGLDVRYLQEGAVKLSVVSRVGKEGVVAMLTPGDFFGECVLAGQHLRIASATALIPSRVLSLSTDVVTTLLHNESGFADRFLKHMLDRNIRVEADLVDQLFNSSERRLARTLLLLDRFGQENPKTRIPRLSQETLAEIVGTTRSRVNFFMNKFRKLGLIEYDGYDDVLKVNSSLFSVVLKD